MSVPDPNQWLVEYDGYGVVDQTTNGTILMQPGYVVAPNTSACLVTSVSSWSGDVTVKARMRTLEQRPSGNPWEVAWLYWNYHREANPNAEQGTGTNDGWARFAYYLALKPNGVEVGKLDQTHFTGSMGGQRYLYTDSTPTYPIDGTYRAVEIRQTGALITVLVDGVQVAAVTDTADAVAGETVYTSGGIGLYCEDSRVEFTDTYVGTTRLLPPTDGSTVMAAGSRYTLVPENLWSWLGPAFRGLDQDLKTLETSGVQATGNIDAGQITSGVVAPNRLGTGSPDASMILYGDGTWKAAPTTTGSVTSVAWADVTGKPAFVPVATTGQYADLINKPDLSVYATSASPTFTGTATFTGVTVVGLGIDASAIKTGTVSSARLGSGTRDATTVLYGDSTYKVPTVSAANVTGVLAPAKLGSGTTDATTILYGDGTWKAAPTGGGTASSVAWADVTGKPTFATVATSGSYDDLTNKPTIPNTFDASAIVSGVMAAARLGTGTASPSTFLNGANAWVTVDKNTVGLGNVDNTADAAKTFAASQIISGTFTTARLGTGTASSSTILYGDGTWKTAPSATPATTDASQLTSGTLANARLSTAVPLISRDPATRPTTDANVMVQFWCTTQPTAMLNGDVWMQTP